LCRRAIVQLIAGPTAPNTLETLVPTERIDAMAATAINEAISVYSITVAPWVFFMRRRKKDSMISLADSTKGGPGPLVEPLREETYLTVNLTSIKTLRTSYK
jgi:hypothetical protein